MTVHVDDGRSFLRKSREQYDLIIFALPDSLTLTSQFASLRLESFLFTEEAFHEARARLAPDGALVLYNYYRETWLLRKLAGMMETAFDAPPYVVSYGGWGRARVLVTGPAPDALLPARPDLTAPTREAAGGRREVDDDPDAILLPRAGAGAARRATTRPARRCSTPVTPATDEWPLMYLRAPALPGVYIAGLAMVAVIALGLIFGLAGRRPAGFNPQMFFLGAAFMLLETRSLVTFSLLFGSTWLVKSLVFFAILCSVMLAVVLSARLPHPPDAPAVRALCSAP